MFESDDWQQSTSPSLVRRAQGNDPSAWCRLVSLYGPLVVHWCRKAGLSEADRADVAQNVFLAVARKLSKFQHDGGTFRGWLYTITRHAVMDHFRQLRARPVGIGGDSHYQELLEHTVLPENEMDRTSEGVRALYQRVLTLLQSEFEPQTWEAFRLLTIDELSGAEVAERLGIRRSAVYNAKARVLRRLRSELDEPNFEGA